MLTFFWNTTLLIEGTMPACKSMSATRIFVAPEPTSNAARRTYRLPARSSAWLISFNCAFMSRSPISFFERSSSKLFNCATAAVCQPPPASAATTSPSRARDKATDRKETVTRPERALSGFLLDRPDLNIYLPDFVRPILWAVEEVESVPDKRAAWGCLGTWQRGNRHQSQRTQREGGSW
eukprot:1925927-Rhodomonas_salina.1